MLQLQTCKLRELSPWDTLREWWYTCESHEFKLVNQDKSETSNE